MKYIYFHEDIRPPYIGTYTKKTLKSSARNPFLKLRNDTDYDYDSEAEWDEPEEGEDLDSEAASDLESVDTAEDMGEFLDDEEDGPKRKMILDMQPICSGICWEDENRVLPPDRTDLNSFRMVVIDGKDAFGLA